METSALDGTGVNQAFYTGTVHANLDNSLLEIIKIKQIYFCFAFSFELKIKSWKKYTILKGDAANQKEDL